MSDSPVSGISDPLERQPEDVIPAHLALIGERYQVTEVLGKGGMGMVLKARHTSLSKFVAIKILHSNMLMDETNRARFELEAQAGSKLSHPNLVSVFDYGFTSQKEPYLVMEFIDGESIDDWVWNKGPLKNAEFLDVFIQTCKALQYIHNNGIIHRDLKTSNIMTQVIEGERYVKLVDFGIAKVLSEDGMTQQHLTATGSVFGSPPYMSPEQCRGLKIDARSDLYSLGCVMFECINGDPPFLGENALLTIHMHISEKPAALRLNSGLASDARIAGIIYRCLEKDPENRFQSANDLLQALIHARDEDNAQRISMNMQSSVGGSVQQGTFQPPSTFPPGMSAAGDPRAVKPSFDGLFETAPPNAVPGGTGLHPSHTGTEAGDSASNKPELEEVETGLRSQLKIQGQTDSHFLRSTGTHRIADPFKTEQVKKLRDEMKPAVQQKDLAPKNTGKWIKIAAVVVFIIILIPASYFGLTYFQKQQTVNTLNSTLQQAQNEMNKKNWSQARAKYEELLKKTNPENEEAVGRIYTKFGTISLNEGSLDTASGEFKKAEAFLRKKKEENAEDYVNAVFGLGQVFARKGKLGRMAEEQFAEARQMASDWNLPAEKQAEIAVESAKNVSKHNPETAVYHYDQALNLYSKSSAKPADKVALCLLESARLRASLGKTDDAMKRAQKALVAGVDIADAEVKRELEEGAGEIIDRAKALRQTGQTNSPATSTGSNNSDPQQVSQTMQAVTDKSNKGANGEVVGTTGKTYEQLMKEKRVLDLEEDLNVKRANGIKEVIKHLDTLRSVSAQSSSSMPTQHFAPVSSSPMSSTYSSGKSFKKVPTPILNRETTLKEY